MNKRELSKVERPEATEDMFSLAERTEKEKYIVTAERIEVSEEKILLLNFFKRSELAKKKSGAAFRTFLSRDDYITQDLETASVKWKIGCFKNLIGWQWWNTEAKGHDIVIANEQDYQVLCQYMKKYQKSEDNSPWNAVERFQDEVMERRLKERRKKETDKIDRKMEQVPELPKGFEQWAHDSVMADKRYLVYKASKKRVLDAYCTDCRKAVQIDTKMMKPRYGQRSRCPACGGEVTCIPKGYFPAYNRDTKWACLIQRITTGIVARYFRVFLEIQRDNDFEEAFSVSEFCRVFFEENDIELRKETYEWDVYKQRGPFRWCPSMGKYRCEYAVLYTDNLPQAFEGTTFRYCAADLFQRKKGYDEIPIYLYLHYFPANRFLEYFVKAGMLNMVNDIVNGNIYNLDRAGKTPVEILQIPKDYIRILAEIDGTEGEYRLLKQCADDKVLVNADEIQAFYERFGEDETLLSIINTHMKIGKFVRYADKQRKMIPVKQEQPCCHAGMISAPHYTKEEKEQLTYRGMARDWIDYMNWCTQLGYDTKDLYVLLPPDFQKAHDRLMGEYQEYKDKLERKRRAEIERTVKRVLEETKNIRAANMKTKKLMLVIPQSAEEIRAEGRALHHCVGTYVERVAQGETMILFIRRTDNPEKSFFTMEYRNGRVIQCRGKNNCSPTKEVQTFVKAFEEKMKSEEERIMIKVG